MSKTIRPVHAKVGDIVRIIWHGEKDQLTEHHSAPPDEVWRVRVAQEQAMKALTPKLPEES
jgi:hypothetical protein